MKKNHPRISIIMDFSKTPYIQSVTNDELLFARFFTEIKSRTLHIFGLGILSTKHT